MRTLLTIYLTALFALLGSAAPNGAPLRTAIFNPQFQTLKIAKADDFMAPPAIKLNSDERITVSFDQIAEDFTDLRYRLVHCNADWQPSVLDDSEFVDGFNSQDIGDYANSQATLVHFVNYRVELPSESAPITRSGNYVLQVFPRENPDSIVLQARFMVYEELAALQGSIATRTLKGDNTHWQQLAVEASLHSEELPASFNPYSNLRLHIAQNGSQLASATLPAPLKCEGNRVSWQNQNQLIFPAGNEYRRFEALSTAFEGMRVDSIRFRNEIYNIYLQPDRNRRFAEYDFDRTQHGRFKVRAYNATDSDLAADYAVVHFNLTADKIPGMSVFIDGEFTHGNFSDFNRATYDPATGSYTAAIPLKLGNYNYRYLAIPDNSASIPDPGEAFEGNKYETENEYWLSLFLTLPGARADRLIGFAKLQ